MRKIIEKIQKDGWGSIPPALIYQFKLFSRNLYRQLILRNKVIIRLFPLQKPPILLLSYPRSGSSWVGDILATSEEVAYLFEPVTQSYQKYQGGIALADLSDEITFQKYCEYSEEAFLGMPLKKQLSRENLSGFSPNGRRKRRLLIKEVNPRAAGFYSKRFQPFILFLVRHPAAAALSFWEMGWLAAPEVQMASVRLDGDDWEKFGYSYGVTMKNAFESIKRLSVPYKILFYEHLARDPLTEFEKVFEYMSVDLPRNYQNIIEEYCFTDKAVQGYETRRVSDMMIAKWKNHLAQESIASIRKGYLLSGIRFYTSRTDWEVDGLMGIN